MYLCLRSVNYCLRSKLDRVLSDIVKGVSVSDLGSLYRKRVEDSEN